MLADANGIGFLRNTRHVRSNIDVVAAGGKILAGQVTQSNVVVADGVELKRGVPICRVSTAGRVKDEGIGSIASVITAAGIISERTRTGSRVEVAFGIVKERIKAGRGVVAARRVKFECIGAMSTVLRTGGIVIERFKAGSRVVAGRIAGKSGNTDGRVIITNRVSAER